jgi:hypothetical protein
MVRVKRQTALSRRIPPDVRARINKVGAKQVDWYAGRLDLTDDTGYSSVPPNDLDALRATGKARRKQGRDDKVKTAITAIAAVARRVLPRRTRPLSR